MDLIGCIGDIIWLSYYPILFLFWPVIEQLLLLEICKNPVKPIFIPTI
jgi:hypothetical protein